MAKRYGMPMVVVDLDSTLADTRHRQHLTPYKVPSHTWVDYSMLCGDDVLITGTAQLLALLYPRHLIYFLSGRNEEAREFTASWLVRHQVSFDHLELRPSRFNDADPLEWKLSIIQEWQRTHRIVLVIDDHVAICEAVSARCGIPALCVSPPLVEDSLRGL